MKFWGNLYKWCFWTDLYSEMCTKMCTDFTLQLKIPESPAAARANASRHCCHSSNCSKWLFPTLTYCTNRDPGILNANFGKSCSMNLFLCEDARGTESLGSPTRVQRRYEIYSLKSRKLIKTSTFWKKNICDSNKLSLLWTCACKVKVCLFKRLICNKTIRALDSN